MKKKEKNSIDEPLENNSDNEGEEEEPEFVQKKYDPTLSSRIICVELANNQKIYVNYTEKSTIRDLIDIIINRHEYKMLNYYRNNIIAAPNNPSLYDLTLSFYEDIKPQHENKLSLDVLIVHLPNIIIIYQDK